MVRQGRIHVNPASEFTSPIWETEIISVVEMVVITTFSTIFKFFLEDKDLGMGSAKPFPRGSQIGCWIGQVYSREFNWVRNKIVPEIDGRFFYLVRNWFEGILKETKQAILRNMGMFLFAEVKVGALSGLWEGPEKRLPDSPVLSTYRMCPDCRQRPLLQGYILLF